MKTVLTVCAVIALVAPIAHAGDVKKTGDSVLNSLSKFGMKVKNSVCKPGEAKCASAKNKAKSATNSATKAVKSN